jgi:hypothetical protein
MLRTVTATRYVEAFREGGSLPGLVEADDQGLYVVKFRGAGQGPKVLIAELLAGEIARTLGLTIPEIVFLEMDAMLGRSEPDFEIQALLKASAGLNLALDFLPGSLAFDALDLTQIEPYLASAIVWFDAFILNVDRTARNTNMLWWHRKLQLIDHGAALYFHHIKADPLAYSRSRFANIKDHVLLPKAHHLDEVDTQYKALLTPTRIQEILALLPASWLENDPIFPDPETQRQAYYTFFLDRLEHSRIFVEEAERVRREGLI